MSYDKHIKVTVEPDSDKPSKKDILDRFYELRKFELEHLWQRAIFLTPLLVLCFTGYFAIVSTQFSGSKEIEKITAVKDDIPVYEVEYECSKTEQLLVEAAGKDEVLVQIIRSEGFAANVVCLCIALCGIVFSVLWVCMMRGSKAWYEVYEEKIYRLESELGIEEDFLIGEHSGYKKKGFLGAGPFSVSKVNVLIGYVVGLIWCAIFLAHLLLLLMPADDTFSLFLIGLLCFALVVAGIYWWLASLVKSKSLEKK